MENISKREERITALEILYSYDMNNEYVFLNPTDDYTDYVNEIVNYVVGNLENVDALISKSLVNYRINRLSYVDRAIIRIATAEMLLKLPVTIAINEALEIVKVYSDQGDGAAVRFINKVLDNISKNIER